MLCRLLPCHKFAEYSPNFFVQLIVKQPNPNSFGALRMTRRRLLTSTASLAAAAFGSSLMPPNLRKALADPPKRSGLHDIKHVVILMQENQSFDHYFGTMAGVRGFDDPTAMILPGGKSVFHQMVICCPSVWILGPRARKKYLPPATPGTSSMKLGTAARWITGCRPIAKRTA